MAYRLVPYQNGMQLGEFFPACQPYDANSSSIRRSKVFSNSLVLPLVSLTVTRYRYFTQEVTTEGTPKADYDGLRPGSTTQTGCWDSPFDSSAEVCASISSSSTVPTPTSSRWEVPDRAPVESEFADTVQQTADAHQVVSGITHVSHFVERLRYMCPRPISLRSSCEKAK